MLSTRRQQQPSPWAFFLGLVALLSLALQSACGGGGSSTPVPPPLGVIASFVAAKSPLTSGASTTLTASFSNGTGAIDHSVGAVTSGTPVTITPTTDTTYTLTVTNSAGVTTTAAVNVSVVAAPVITSFAVTKSPLTSGASTTLTASFSNGTGAVDHSVGAITSGTPVTITPTTDTTYTLTVTNAAGLSTTAAVSVPVVAAPVATSLTATVNPVPYGGSTTVTPVFSAGTGSVDQSVGAVTTGSGFASGVITAPKTFTLLVANTAGSFATKTLTLTPQTVAVTSLSPASSTVSVGSSATFSATVTGGATGTVTWAASAGSITAAGVWTAPATAGSATITATSVDDTSKTATTTITYVAAPALPVITAASPVTAGQAGYTASVSAQAGMTLAWTVTGGTITAGAGTTTITYTPGASGSVSFSCVASNAAGTPSSAGVATAAIVAEPVATSLVATANLVPYNGSTTVTPTFSGGTATVNGTTVTTGTGLSSGVITASKLFTLTVTNAAGSTATKTLTLAPQTVAVGALSPAAPTVAVSTPTTFGSTVTGGATNGVTWTATSGAITSGGVWTAPAAAGTATITATSSDDASKTASTTVTVVGLPGTPVISLNAYVTGSLAGATASVPAQPGMTFTWTATGATITAGAGTNSITFTPAATGTVTLSCLAANPLGTASAAVTATATIVAAPVTPTLVAAVNPVLLGSSTTVTPTFSGGTGEVNHNVGAVISGVSFPSGTLTDPKIFILTVTNQAGTTATATLTVRVQDVKVAGITPLAPKVSVNSSTAFTATVTGAVNTAVNWSSTGGSWLGNTWTAPDTTGVYTLKATSSADPSKSATTVVTVVNAPGQPIVASPAYVTTGKAGYTASVDAQTGMTYAWTILNGRITAGAGTASVTFTAGATGQVSLSCSVSDGGSTNLSDTALIPIVPLAVITNFSADKADVVAAGAAILSATYRGGTGVITPGNHAIASGASWTVNPASTTTYTLTVTNAAGDTTTDTLTITVAAAPSISFLKANPATITAGQGTLLTFSFTGTGVITPGDIPVTSGEQLPISPASTTLYTLTVRNAAATTTTATVTVTVLSFTSKFAYVANSGGGVSAYTLTDTTGVLAELATSPFDATVNALHVTSDPQGKFLFVVNGDGLANVPNTVTAYTIASSTGILTKVGTYPTGTNPWASAVAPSGNYLYVRCDGTLSVYAIDATTGALTAGTPVTAAGGTGDVLVHPSGRQLYSLGRTTDQLQVFDLAADTGVPTLHSSLGLPFGAGALSLALSNTGEVLFTKSEGAASGAAQECIVYAYQVEIEAGGLTALAPMDTGLTQADSYHGVSANPTQSVIYLTLSTTHDDYAAYAYNLLTGELTALTDSPYELFGGTGSDSLVVSRNGKWGLLTNYNGNEVAIGAINSGTGVLATPTHLSTGSFPVCVTVVGTF